MKRDTYRVVMMIAATLLASFGAFFVIYGIAALFGWDPSDVAAWWAVTWIAGEAARREFPR